jgi:hypothetical protein
VPLDGEHELFGLLATEANAIVAPVRAKAIPVILATLAEVDLWLEGETSDALALQPPLGDDVLGILPKGQREDGPLRSQSNSVSMPERSESTLCCPSRSALRTGGKREKAVFS